MPRRRSAMLYEVILSIFFLLYFLCWTATIYLRRCSVRFTTPLLPLDATYSIVLHAHNARCCCCWWWWRTTSRHKKKNPGEIMIPDKSSLLMSEVKHNVSRVADIFYFRSSARATKGTMWSLIISQACAMMVAILTLTVGAWWEKRRDELRSRNRGRVMHALSHVAPPPRPRPVISRTVVS